MCLVFGRAQAGGDEPLIAVVANAAQAQAIEARILAQAPLASVAWEFAQVDGGSAQDEVSLVVQSGTESSAIEVANPVCVGVFAQRAHADAFASEREGDGLDYAVGTFRLGWQRPGWPLDDPGPTQSTMPIKHKAGQTSQGRQSSASFSLGKEPVVQSYIASRPSFSTSGLRALMIRMRSRLFKG